MATFPTETTVRRVDYRIHESLNAFTKAFQGQNAVVCAAATKATWAQKTIIDDAVAARVKRFIRSEFGCNTRETRGAKIRALLGQKIEIVESRRAFQEVGVVHLDRDRPGPHCRQALSLIGRVRACS